MSVNLRPVLRFISVDSDEDRLCALENWLGPGVCVLPLGLMSFEQWVSGPTKLMGLVRAFRNLESELERVRFCAHCRELLPARTTRRRRYCSERCPVAAHRRRSLAERPAFASPEVRAAAGESNCLRGPRSVGLSRRSVRIWPDLPVRRRETALRGLGSCTNAAASMEPPAAAKSTASATPNAAPPTPAIATKILRGTKECILLDQAVLAHITTPPLAEIAPMPIRTATGLSMRPLAGSVRT